MLVLPGDDGTDRLLPEEAIQEIETFLTGASAHATTSDRTLAAVLYTDIVGSTERAANLGDQRLEIGLG